MAKMLRVNEAARELGVSEAWLRRAERRGRIPHARRDMNGWRVYADEDIVALRGVLFPMPSNQLGGTLAVLIPNDAVHDSLGS
jgi:hypothetical protein